MIMLIQPRRKVGSNKYNDQPDENRDDQLDEDHDDQPDIKDQRQVKPNDGKQSNGTGHTRPEPKGSKMKQK